MRLCTHYPHPGLLLVAEKQPANVKQHKEPTKTESVAINSSLLRASLVVFSSERTPKYVDRGCLKQLSSSLSYLVVKFGFGGLIFHQLFHSAALGLIPSFRKSSRQRYDHVDDRVPTSSSNFLPR